MHFGEGFDFAATMLQPVGGMDRIAREFAARLGDAVTYDARVGAIRRSGAGARILYSDGGGAERALEADYVICTIPLPVLAAIPADFSADLADAIRAGRSIKAAKVGFQSRRFWEEDEAIYGGISYTDLPIRQIGYPVDGINRGGRGILLGAYQFGSANAYEFTSMSPADRVERAVAFGSRIHPQYKSEFENGISVAWHRVPFTLGCAGEWSDKARAEHYDNLCQIDGRIVLAGEHASYIPAWQEGAILSSLDAITRLHERVIKA